ncbi:MAG: DUF2269 domain-containing protein, partial [Gemmatimonadetes bacterium]|nr:DUF2269 domain-containing protein [Gemmatimonadota bacterium]
MYLMLKLLHIAAVILFLGNITTGVLWKAHADRTGDPRLIAHTLAGIIRSDRWFTMPGVVAILISGFGAAGVAGYPLLRTGWIFWSIVLFTISGVAFMIRVAPLQRQMLALAQRGIDSGSFDAGSYQELSRSWAFWGLVALVTPAAAVVLMVL